MIILHGELMLEWMVVFSTNESDLVCPRVLTMAGERQCSASYRHEGRMRGGETQYLLKYTLEGEGAISDADGEHLVPKGSALLCRVSDPEIVYYYRPRETREWRFVYVTFSGEAASSWASSLISRHGHVYEFPESSDIVHRIMAFSRSVQKQCLVEPDWSAEFVSMLLVTLERSKCGLDRGSPASGLVRRAQELVSQNIDRAMNVMDLAGMLGVSREHLTRVFKSYYGSSPYDYILAERMKYAGYLIRHSSQSIKEIAGGLGFDSAAHFARTFKRLMKETPVQFRLHGRA